MEALEKLVDVISKYGEVEASLAAANIESYSYHEDQQQQVEKGEAKRTAEGNKFVQELLGSLGQNSGAQNGQKQI